MPRRMTKSSNSNGFRTSLVQGPCTGSPRIPRSGHGCNEVVARVSCGCLASQDPVREGAFLFRSLANLTCLSVGKSVLSSKIISFVQSNPKQRVLFFFCDYHTPAYGIAAHIFRVFCCQVLRFLPELVSFFYDEYLCKDLSPSAAVLKRALSTILKDLEFGRLVVDGIDELPPREHKSLINELVDLTISSGDTCKLLICSQDLPSISPTLSRKLKIPLGDEKEGIQKDIKTIVAKALEDLNENRGGMLEVELLNNMAKKIVDKAEGKLNSPFLGTETYSSQACFFGSTSFFRSLNTRLVYTSCRQTSMPCQRTSKKCKSCH